MEFSFLEFIANAGGPTIVAVVALYIVFRQNVLHSSDRAENLAALTGLQEQTLTVVRENTAVLSTLSAVMEARNPAFAAIEKHTEASTGLMRDVRECLKENIKVSTELRTLLVGMNGKHVVASKKR